jgi:hypothetical protein
MDAGWYLAIASDLNDELPIDRQVEQLSKLGILGGADEGKRAARHAVHAALKSAYDGPADAKMRQAGRKKTPVYWSRLKDRADEMLNAYSDIEASLEGSNARVALNHVEAALAERLPPEKLKDAMSEYTAALYNFHNAAFALSRFRDILEIATAEVAPKLGRPSTAMYFFVRTLGKEWLDLSGTRPTRHFDAIEGVESGPFYKFCVAAAKTVEALLPSASLDAAIRKVTDEWKPKPPPPNP